MKLYENIALILVGGSLMLRLQGAGSYLRKLAQVTPCALESEHLD